MKLNTLLLLTLMSGPAFLSAQQDKKKSEQAIKEVIHSFFQVLVTKDTAAYSRLMMPEGQIWRLKMSDQQVKTDVRIFATDKINLASMRQTIQERALDYEIKIHGHIATAWVPYTLDVDDQFSHCGIDVFTLMLTDEGWRIATLAYTIEPEGCDEVVKR